MTTTTATPETQTPQSTKDRPSLFKHAAWVHIGEGAEECEQRFAKCDDDAHFHAWVRLANPYQVQDIIEKATAAKARRMRMLRDPDSDASVILEDELAEIRQSILDAEQEGQENAMKAILVDEVFEADFQEDYTRAVREVDDLEDESAEPKDDGKLPKLYANIDADREEYERQRELPEDQRGDDYEELEKTVANYSREIDRVMDANRAPRREALMAKSADEWVEMVRRDRIDRIAAEVHLQTFNLWQTFVCTYRAAGVKGDKPITPRERYFKSMEQLRFETPTDVVAGLHAAFRELEQTQGTERMRAAGKAS